MLKSDQVFKIRVEIAESDPLIWRTFSIPTGCSFRHLHEALQIIMDWTDTHLHMFELNDFIVGAIDDEFPDDDTIDEKTAILSEYLSCPDTLIYFYDFGGAICLY